MSGAGQDRVQDAEGSRRPGRTGLVSAVLVAATLAAYLPVLGNGFVDYDDNLYVTATPEVRSGLSGSGVAWAFTPKAAGQFHPLTWLSHMLDCEVFGLRPWGHHLTSLLFHVAGNRYGATGADVGPLPHDFERGRVSSVVRRGWPY